MIISLHMWPLITSVLSSANSISQEKIMTYVQNFLINLI